MQGVYAGCARTHADAQLERGMQYLTATGSRRGQGYMHAWRALALAHLGRYEEARQQAETARERCRITGEIVHLPWGAHARGVTELLDLNAAPEAAERWFLIAVCKAHSQGNRWMELRAANSLARLWQSRGRQREAYDLLAPIYNWFTEGFDTKDLKQAKALLDDVS